MPLLKPRTTSVLIYQGDDLETLAELHRAVVRAERRRMEAEVQAEAGTAAPRRGGDADPVADLRAAEKDAQDEYDAFVAQAAPRAVDVRLLAIGSTRFARLVAQHPARTVTVDGKEQTHADDADFGVDTTTFGKALLRFVNEPGNVRTVLGPKELHDPDTLAEFLDDECSEGDVERLWTTAYWLNRAEGLDPKATRFSPS